MVPFQTAKRHVKNVKRPAKMFALSAWTQIAVYMFGWSQDGKMMSRLIAPSKTVEGDWNLVICWRLIWLQKWRPSDRSGPIIYIEFTVSYRNKIIRLQIFYQNAESRTYSVISHLMYGLLFYANIPTFSYKKSEFIFFTFWGKMKIFQFRSDQFFSK